MQTFLFGPNPWHKEQCLARSRCSINSCRIHKSMNSLQSPFQTRPAPAQLAVGAHRSSPWPAASHLLRVLCAHFREICRFQCCPCAAQQNGHVSLASFLSLSSSAGHRGCPQHVAPQNPRPGAPRSDGILQVAFWKLCASSQGPSSVGGQGEVRLLLPTGSPGMSAKGHLSHEGRGNTQEMCRQGLCPFGAGRLGAGWRAQGGRKPARRAERVERARGHWDQTPVTCAEKQYVPGGRGWQQQA